jgi:hypothetical protein
LPLRFAGFRSQSRSSPHPTDTLSGCATTRITAPCSAYVISPILFGTTVFH